MKRFEWNEDTLEYFRKNKNESEREDADAIDAVERRVDGGDEE